MNRLALEAFADELEKNARHPFLAIPSARKAGRAAMVGLGLGAGGLAATGMAMAPTLPENPGGVFRPKRDTEFQSAVRKYYRQHGIDEPDEWRDWSADVPAVKGKPSTSWSAVQGNEAFRAEMKSIVESAARRRGVDPALLATQLRAESGYNPFAQSHTGPLGLGQFTRRTGRGYGLLGGGFDIREDPVAAADASARLMSTLLKTHGGKAPRAVAAYNWGDANINDALRSAGIDTATPLSDPAAFATMRPETQGYLRRILPGEVPKKQ